MISDVVLRINKTNHDEKAILERPQKGKINKNILHRHNSFEY